MWPRWRTPSASAAREATPFQRAFKTAWKKKQKLPVSKRAYETDVAAWCCNCGIQELDAHHLCKHLVQVVPDPPPEFFVQVVRCAGSPSIGTRISVVRRMRDVDTGESDSAFGDMSDARRSRLAWDVVKLRVRSVAGKAGRQEYPLGRDGSGRSDEDEEVGGRAGRRRGVYGSSDGDGDGDSGGRRRGRTRVRSRQ